MISDLIKIRYLPIAMLAFAFAAAEARAETVPNQAPVVDLTPAIKIGDFTISRYLFEKAYNQFIAANTHRKGQKPSREEAENWFPLYMAQLMIKADLVEQKQLDRPEVVETTERMARYMLTQPNGPLYLAIEGADRITFRRERRERILKECHFATFPENVTRFWTAIAPQFGRGGQLRETDVASIGTSILANYIFDGKTKQISASDFVRNFQQGIARIAPHDVLSLGNQIEDIAIAEYDWAEAITLHIDKAPQFLEDRHNFELNQALALYEKEVLTPQISFSTDDLRKYYIDHLELYKSPIEISGVLYVFRSRETAQKAQSILGSGNPALLVAQDSETVIDPLIVRRDAPTLLTEIPYNVLASLPDGRSIGPFPHQDGFGLFYKKSTGEAKPLRFEEVQEGIRVRYLREKLNAKERELADQNLDRVKVLIDLAQYELRWPMKTGERDATAAGSPRKSVNTQVTK
jgi:hypothetical protein